MNYNQIIIFLESLLTILENHDKPIIYLHEEKCKIENILDFIKQLKQENDKLKENIQFLYETNKCNSQRALDVTVEEIKNAKLEILSEIETKLEEKSYVHNFDFDEDDYVKIVEFDDITDVLQELKDCF